MAVTYLTGDGMAEDDNCSARLGESNGLWKPSREAHTSDICSDPIRLAERVKGTKLSQIANRKAGKQLRRLRVAKSLLLTAERARNRKGNLLGVEQPERVGSMWPKPRCVRRRT